MKILHIGKYYSPFKGGIENFVQGLAEQQVQAGHQVHCIVHQERPLTGTREESINGVVLTRFAIIARLLFTPIAPSLPFRIRSLCRSFGPDVIHCHMPNPSALWALWIPASYRQRLIVHWHADVMGAESGLMLKLAYPLYRLFERALLKRCKLIIATSPPYAAGSETLQPWLDKVRVIPLGIKDYSNSEPVPLSADGQQVPFRLLCLGRLTYYKGHEFLIRAVAESSAVQLTLVGDGEERSKLQTLVQQLGIADRVNFLGRIEDKQVLAELASCQCLCLPSIEKSEAFGVVLLEAMRAARPVIVSDVPGSGMGWVVQNNKTGILVTPGDSQELREAIIELRDNPARCAALGNAGRQRFLENFTLGRIAQLTEQLYHDMTNAN